MGTLIHALEKRLREREREDRSRVVRLLNLLIIALCGLASSCLRTYPFFSHLGCHSLTPSVHA